MSLKMQVYQQLSEKLRTIIHLESLMAILSWDREMMTPKGGIGARADQLATFASLYHQHYTEPVLGDLINQCLDKKESLQAWQLANVIEAKRGYDKRVRVPHKLVEEITRLEVKAHDVWVESREKSDFAIFQNILEKLITLSKSRAACVEPTLAAYDVLLDDYEQGWDQQKFSKTFSDLKQFLVPFLQQVKDKQSQDNLSHTDFSASLHVQETLGKSIIKKMGFDFSHGRMDQSVHPFCGGVGPYDVRITTRYDEKHFLSSLLAFMHEAGHALYEQGRRTDLADQPVSQARSMSFHESQSLLWEKQVGQSQDFLKYFLPEIKKQLPEFSANGAEIFLAVNRVKDSLIRVEADEISYPLHVMLRFEMERDLFADNLQVKDIPQVWNQKMQDYLGLKPKNDAEGCLQDVHWSMGAFGYFPSYSLGAMLAAQIFAAAQNSMPDLSKNIQTGNFVVLRNWLKEKIHQQGSILNFEDLCQFATGDTFNSKYFIQYLQQKYL